ncbi:MAG: response regulator [Chloroflexota bacterium]|nr:response regulator [Chloroflexota bacterium]
MSNRQLHTVNSSADWAEGIPPRLDDEPFPQRLTRFPDHRNITSPGISPKSETGVMQLVMALDHAGEDDNMQDALQSRAETRPYAEPTLETYTPTVLIVEDAFELAEILQLTLRRLKLRTVHESFGGRASERYRELQPDVVLLDISLPDIPGWQVLENIKESSKAMGSRMPIVIVITAFGDPANRLIGKLQGVYRYLIKPFTPREVEQIVKEALSTRLG